MGVTIEPFPLPSTTTRISLLGVCFLFLKIMAVVLLLSPLKWVYRLTSKTRALFFLSGISFPQLMRDSILEKLFTFTYDFHKNRNRLSTCSFYVYSRNCFLLDHGVPLLPLPLHLLQTLLSDSDSTSLPHLCLFSVSLPMF